MSVPEPLNTVLVVHMLAAVAMSCLAGLCFFAWCIEKAGEFLLCRYRVAALFIKFSQHRYDFDLFLNQKENGWEYASDMMDEICGCARLFIPDDSQRSNFYASVIRHFQDYGCKNLNPFFLGDEDADPVFLRVYHELSVRESAGYEEQHDDDAEFFMD